MAKRYVKEKLLKVFMSTLLKRLPYHRCGKETIQNIVLVLVLSSGLIPQILSSRSQLCPTTTIDLRSRDRENPRRALFIPDKATTCT